MKTRRPPATGGSIELRKFVPHPSAPGTGNVAPRGPQRYVHELEAHWPARDPEGIHATVAIPKSRHVPTPTVRKMGECTPIRTFLTAEALRRAQVDLGRSIGAVVEEQWENHGCGPTWSETIATSASRGIFNKHLRAGDRHRDDMRHMIKYLCHAQWLTATQEYRSLCTGPVFHADRRGRRRQRADVFGWRVACAIGWYRHRHDGANPTWEQLVAQDASRHNLFVDTDDAYAQSRWLLAAQWVRLEDGGLRRGQAAQDVSRARRQRRRAATARTLP